MKNHKEKNAYIGYSDVASLTVRFPDSVKILNFGCDGDYHAWVVNNWTREQIPAHYEKVITGEHWMRIYDDAGLAYKTLKHYECIEIYRAGEIGILINFIEDKRTLEFDECVESLKSELIGLCLKVETLMIEAAGDNKKNIEDCKNILRSMENVFYTIDKGRHTSTADIKIKFKQLATIVCDDMINYNSNLMINFHFETEDRDEHIEDYEKIYQAIDDVVNAALGMTK